MRGTAAELVVPTTSNEEVYWPEVNNRDIYHYGSYRHNDTLLGYSTVMLAYSMAVYHFPNGAVQHAGQYSVAVNGAENRDMPPALPFHSGINDDPQGLANMYCTMADAADGEINFASEAQYSFNYKVNRFGDGAPIMINSQAAIYRWIRRDEIVITVAFRGSETASFRDQPPSAENILGNIHQIVGDWLGSDLNMQIGADLICHDPNMQMHNGVQNAYLVMGHDITTKLQELLRQTRAAYASKPIKIFVTGHSLGAALADMFTYDISCGGTNAEGLGQPLAGTITYGHFAHWHGVRSANVYKQRVPKERRIRINACAREVQGWYPVVGIGACRYMHSSESCGAESTVENMCTGGTWSCVPAATSNPPAVGSHATVCVCRSYPVRSVSRLLTHRTGLAIRIAAGLTPSVKELVPHAECCEQVATRPVSRLATLAMHAALRRCCARRSSAPRISSRRAISLAQLSLRTM